MKSVTKQILLFILIVGSASGNLVVNGDFEQILSIGWQQSYNNTTFFIGRYPFYDPDPDYEVEIYKSASDGYVKLYQLIDIPNTDLEFSCNLQLYASDNYPGDWAAAALVLSYLNSSDSVLGETRICRYSDADCPWVNSDNLHLIIANDTEWNAYAFNLNDELGNLFGVDPLDVSKIQVALFDTAAFCYS